jgi:protein-disulfide isomerase
VNFVFKEYPVLAPSSEDAARASLAMYYLEPDHYFDYHAALFRLGGKFDEKNLVAVAEGLGADPEKFKEMMKSKRVTDHIEDTRQLAGKMGAQGVPAFIIGGQMFPGAISYEAMKQEVDAVRTAMKKEE